MCVKKVLWHRVRNQKFWLEEYQHLRQFPVRAQQGRMVRGPPALWGLGCLGEEFEHADEICVLVQKILSHNIVPKLMWFAGVCASLYKVVNLLAFSLIAFSSSLITQLWPKHVYEKFYFPTFTFILFSGNHVFAPFFC